ncbi:MAG TPA: porin [Chitinophagaceae bacterium]|nr:porin [Chitinophagaceae bacterium]MCB9055399.1 porin [Chitinophagales bacterium]HPG10660.1 porin [Chitinophagaceae bacterium]HRX92793.1 porin [Chitinophagaceae bacterium]
MRKQLFLLLLIILVSFPCTVIGQRYLTEIDSSFFIKDTVRPLIKRFENLRITGYMQPQFQIAEADGAPSYAGGNFSPYSKTRFMLRRARIKIDYVLPSKSSFPKAQFSFQIDATERGVVVRDMFTRLFETKHNRFSITAGLFARPFGYEVNLSSAFRETPERGRMSQILMPTERDLGVMLSFEPQDKKDKLRDIKLDAGFFNGQGLSGSTDFDSHKDFISRLTIRPQQLGKFEVGAGLSFLRGGWKNGTKYVYKSGKAVNGDKVFIVDSSEANLGKSSPRHYYGGDIQVKIKHGWGESECRAEYWFGTQPGTEFSSRNPGTIPNDNGIPLPTYVRHFNGAFFYFLQNIVNTKHQLLVKFDWYDPNIKVSGNDIGKPNVNLSEADIKYSTLGLGYVYYMNQSTKLIFYYDRVKNEVTQMSGFTADTADDIFTCRLQFRF